MNTKMMIQISETDLRDQLAELAHLRTQVKELQANQTKIVESSLARRVRAFHFKFGHPVAWKPKIPDDEQVRFRLKLIAEEFFELLEASGFDVADERDLVSIAIDDQPLRVDLPEFVDALGDLDYVSEGTRVVFGVDGEPVIAEIQRANMSKDPQYVAAKDQHHREPDPKAKPTKPADWKPPDIEGVLESQGWIKT